jgi:hypothetical protein
VRRERTDHASDDPARSDHRHVGFDPVGRAPIDHHFERPGLRIPRDDAGGQRRRRQAALQIQCLFEPPCFGRLRLFLLQLSLELGHALTQLFVVALDAAQGEVFRPARPHPVGHAGRDLLEPRKHPECHGLDDRQPALRLHLGRDHQNVTEADDQKQ